MAGPFPGIDPYIELEAPWPDFHNRLIAEICNELGTTLPGSYVVRVDERIEVATSGMAPLGRSGRMSSSVDLKRNQQGRESPRQHARWPCSSRSW